MALEGLLTKLGPTLVREATPHVMQIVAGFAERFRKDTREIKDSMDAEIASVARAHAGLVTSLDDQGARLDSLREKLIVVDRRVELLHKLFESHTRQLSSDTEKLAAQHRSARNLALVAAVSSGLACAGVLASFFLHH